jgi:hypothetical protein
MACALWGGRFIPRRESGVLCGINNNQKHVLTEPSLTVNIVSNAKRYKKITNYHWRKEPNPLWWSLSNLPVLQKT